MIRSSDLKFKINSISGRKSRRKILFPISRDVSDSAISRSQASDALNDKTRRVFSLIEIARDHADRSITTPNSRGPPARIYHFRGNTREISKCEKAKRSLRKQQVSAAVSFFFDHPPMHSRRSKGRNNEAHKLSEMSSRFGRSRRIFMRF